MVRYVTEEEKNIISQLAEVGKTDKEIAEALGWHTNLKNPERAVAKQRRKLGMQRGNRGDLMRKPDAPLVAKTKLLETMTKDERFQFIKNRISSSPRNKLVLQTFSDEEKDSFFEQYYGILQSTDSITEAEEQQLFAAMVEYVLAFRALSMKTEEERCVQETLRGDHETDDPRYKLKVDRRHDEEYTTHLQNYQSFMDGLKMSRKQRLDKVKSEKRTLIDVASELANATDQSLAIDEIERLAVMSDDALKIMLENKHLLGNFEKK